MKIPGKTPSRRGGFSLIEVLVYMGLFFLITGCATVAFTQFWDESHALRRDTEDIVRALDAGDRWRADLRSASGKAEVSVTNGDEVLRIPSARGDIFYEFSNGQLHRQGGGGPRVVLLPNVKSSRMEADARSGIPAWRWELELKTSKRTAQVRPLFTFEAVPGGASQ